MSPARERAQAAQHDTYRRMLRAIPLAVFSTLPPTAGPTLPGRCVVCDGELQRKPGAGRPPKFCGTCRDTWPAIQWQRAQRVLRRAAA